MPSHFGWQSWIRCMQTNSSVMTCLSCHPHARMTLDMVRMHAWSALRLEKYVNPCHKSVLFSVAFTSQYHNFQITFKDQLSISQIKYSRNEIFPSYSKLRLNNYHALILRPKLDRMTDGCTSLRFDSISYVWPTLFLQSFMSSWTQIMVKYLNVLIQRIIHNYLIIIKKSDQFFYRNINHKSSNP